MHEEPTHEQQWLKKFLGDWTSEMEGDMGPDQPPMTSKGTETGRSIGNWIISEGEAEMADGTKGQMIMTLGYDPNQKRFLGTWIGSMMSHLWVYDGKLDDAERVLTLSAEGPHMETPGRMVQYRDVYEFVNDDHRVLTSHVLGDDGQWREFMKANYHRKK